MSTLIIDAFREIDYVLEGPGRVMYGRLLPDTRASPEHELLDGEMDFL